MYWPKYICCNIFWRISCWMWITQETETGQAVANVRALTYCEITFNNLDFEYSNSKAQKTQKYKKKLKSTKKYKTFYVCIVKVISTWSTGNDCWRFLKWNWKINTSVLKLKFNINQVFFRFSSFTRPFHSLFLATFFSHTTWGTGWDHVPKKGSWKWKSHKV